MKTYKSIEMNSWDPIGDPESRIIKRETIENSLQDDFKFDVLQNDKVGKSVVFDGGLKRLCYLETGHTLIESIV